MDFDDSDLEMDTQWLQTSEHKSIEGYMDLHGKDKSFFVLWNSFVARQPQKNRDRETLNRNLLNFQAEHLELLKK
jgi:hypothetical protein